MSSASQQPWLAKGEGKRDAVRGLFSSIAPKYDLLNTLLSFNQHGRWRSVAVGMAAPAPGDSALDVCCGTGDFLIPLRKSVGESGKVAGLDFCQPMLDVAATKTGHDASLTLGDACELPYESGIFDVVTVGWGLRNVPDLDKALSEANRVLKPGGRLVSLDMVNPTSLMGKIGQWVNRKAAPILGALFGHYEAYKYLPESSVRFLTLSELSNEFERAGFEKIKTKTFMFGNIGLHLGTKR